MPGKIDRQENVLHPGQLGVALIHQYPDQFGQVHDRTQPLFQFVQVETQYLFLDVHAAQGFVCQQSRADGDGLFRGKAPDQDFGDVVQQGGERDFLDVQLVALDGPEVGVTRGPLCATDDLQDAEQGLRLVFQHGLDGWRFANVFEERLNALHHDGIADVGDVRVQAFADEGLDIGQHTNRHQRILQDDGSNIPAVDAVHFAARFFKLAQRFAQHRHFGLAEKIDPAFEAL